MATLKDVLGAWGKRVALKMDDVAMQEASEMRSEIIEGWPVDTGASRAAWQGPVKVGHAHYRLSNDYEYAPVIEYGGYPGVGPKTEQVGAHVLPGGIEVNRGIYPSQRPAAPVRRAISKRTLPFQEAVSKVLRNS